jgi:polysaccharide deacetylase family protein (PEP-CTERM system associated)
MASSFAPSNIFTVDLEEWFHVCGVRALAQPQWDRLPSRVELTTQLVLDLLDHASVRATFFIVGWIADRYPRLVETVRAAGHEIGSHSYSHTRAYELGAQGFAEDLAASLRALSSAGVPSVRLFRAPEWSINLRSIWALDQLVRQGFVADASMAPLRMVGDVGFPRYPHMRETASGSLLEIPPFVTDRLGQVMPMGWGWGLRMSSPRAVLRLIEAENRAGRPAVITLHPWEIDPDPPRVKLPVKLHFAHYFRLPGFADRLRRVLDGTSFGPLGAWGSTAGYL